VGTIYKTLWVKATAVSVRLRIYLCALKYTNSRRACFITFDHPQPLSDNVVVAGTAIGPVVGIN
jgi:hypothetical protein